MKSILAGLIAISGIAFGQMNNCPALRNLKVTGMKLEISRADLVPAGPAAGPGGAGAAKGGPGAGKGGPGAGKGGPGAAKAAPAAGAAKGGPGAGKGAAKGGPAPTPVILPEHCRVNGIIDQRTGLDGKTYGIRFAIAMPTNWTGQYLQQGGGGLNGTVGEPTGNQATGTQSALVRGMAVASSDTGHASAGGAFDGGFMQDQLAALDFEFVAIGRLAVLAKEAITQYYGRAPSKSYYVGCSTGGREAMMMSQRYPLYFDGIVAGAPAMRTGHSNLATRTVSVSLNVVAPKDANGRAITAQALSDSDRQAVVAKLLEVCDAQDGTNDGMVFNVTGCKFTPKDLQCSGAKAEGCITAQQAAAIEKGFAGPKDSKGRAVYAGWFYDTGITATGGGIPGLLSGGNSPVGPSPTNTTQDVDAEAATADNNPVSRLGDTYTWTNLNTFSANGGKLLFYHGVSDPWFSAKDTIDYYQRMAAANGGDAKVKDFSRLFLVPGMGHCQGGAATLDQFDMLTALTQWVEQNKAPESVVATGRAFPGRSRPLCAFPTHAQYTGSGDPEKAENYSCQQ